MSGSSAGGDLLELTAQIVSAHVSHNPIASVSVPDVIQLVYRTLADMGKVPAQVTRPTPAVPINRSVSEDHIVCLEDGKRLKMLKRHLKAVYNMTPEQYRERWGLPANYPMVAPEYARRRSTLARQIGLGSKQPRRR